MQCGSMQNDERNIFNKKKMDQVINLVNTRLNDIYPGVSVLILFNFVT